MLPDAMVFANRLYLELIDVLFVKEPPVFAPPAFESPSCEEALDILNFTSTVADVVLNGIDA